MLGSTGKSISLPPLHPKAVFPSAGVCLPLGNTVLRCRRMFFKTGYINPFLKSELSHVKKTDPFFLAHVDELSSREINFLFPTLLPERVWRKSASPLRFP